MRRALTRRAVDYVAAEVPWHTPERAVEVLRRSAEGLAREPGWSVHWCAGAGTTGTSAKEFDHETRAIEACIAGLDAAGTPGRLVLASSAGGVYAGSVDPPFTEAHEPRPLAPYGRAKLVAEDRVAAYCARSGSRAVVTRIANLYGPGQDITKAQGLVSQLCVAHLRRSATSIFVPLDTIRDYVFVDDCAEMMLDTADLAMWTTSPGATTTKIIASQIGTTIATLLGEFRRLGKRPPQVVLAANPVASVQVRDLRLRSTVLTQVDRRSLTPLPAGIAATLAALRRSPMSVA